MMNDRPVMMRLRSLSADYTADMSMRSLLCGTCSAPSSATFYSRHNEDEDSDNTEGGPIKKLCRTLKKPFQKRGGSLRQSARRLLLGQDEEVEPVLFTATAIRTHVPHPYDSQALPFTVGDIIEVTRVTDHGVWAGKCHGRRGNFKFVDVKKDDLRCRVDKARSYPELQTVCQRSKSVSDLLSSINQENLISKFILNGFDTTESVRGMNDDDLEYLGVTDEQTKDLILGTIDWLNMCEEKKPAEEESLRRQSDSGYNSSAESVLSDQNSERKSFLHSSITLSHSEINLTFSTPL